jgi:exosortase E/protease (VPEID-CTERM system)
MPRFAFLLLILFLETVALRLSFDVQVLERATGWWSGLLAGPSGTARVVIAFLAAVLVLSGSRLGILAREFRAQSDGNRHWWHWFAVHVVSFLATFAIATHVASRPVEKMGAEGALGAAGAFLAAIALVSWLAALAPWGYWFRLIRAERFVVLAGVAVAAAAWSLGEWTQDTATPLNEWTFSLVEWILRLVYPDVIANSEEKIIGPPEFTISISAACSGYEGIGLICVFLAAFFWTFRERLRFPQAWLLWPIGIVAIWLCNSVRIAALVMVGTHYSRGIAIRGFHSQAGWLLFNLVALGLMAVALKVPFFVKRELADAPRLKSTPVAAYLIPLLVLVAMNMLVAAFSDGFDWLYPLKVIVTVVVLWQFRAVYKSLDWSWSWGAAINGVLVFAVWMALALIEDHEDSEIPLALQDYSRIGALAWVTFRIIGSVLTVPLVEELAFRGYLLRRFVTADFDEVAYERTPLWAVLISSLLFGLMHGRWLAGTFAGLAYAFAVRRRGKLCDAVVAHAVTNALIAGDVLLTDAWWLW